MSYLRVLPRDLFNEANLLKCLGQLWLLAGGTPNVSLELRAGFEGAGWDIQQDGGDGSIWANNVMFRVKGRFLRLFRPLNSREPWPLYLGDGEDLEIEVFDEHGQLSAAFQEFVR